MWVSLLWGAWPIGVGLCAIHRSAWNSYSRKFAVASDRAEQAPGPQVRPGGASSESERRDLVAFVAPLCSKALRLATSQLPENSCPIGPGPSELRRHGVLRSSLGHIRH